MNATSDKINYIVSSILLTIINVYIDQKLVSYWILSGKGMAGNIMHWKAMSAVASQWMTLYKTFFFSEIKQPLFYKKCRVCSSKLSTD